MAITSPNLGLKLWTLPTDPYNSGQLADNFARLDEHDHANGKGVQIGTGGIQDAAITASKLAPGAIPSPPTQQPVGTSLIVDGAVTTAKLGTGAVTLSILPTDPYALIKRATNQSIGTSSSGATVTFTTMAADTNSMWNAGTPTRLTCQTTGFYFIAAFITTTSVGSFNGVHTMMSIQVNSADVSRQTAYSFAPSNSSIFPSLSTTAGLRLNSTDFIEVRVWTDTNTNVSSANLAACYLSA